jgi:hypothetical protein
VKGTGRSLILCIARIFTLRDSISRCPGETRNGTYLIQGSRVGVIGTATGNGLDGRGVGVGVPVGARIFSSPRHPDSF